MREETKEKGLTLLFLKDNMIKDALSGRFAEVSHTGMPGWYKLRKRRNG